MAPPSSGCAIVTGAAGGIGGAVVRILAEARTPVVAVDLKTRPEDLPADCDWVSGDVNLDATVEKAFHAAASRGGARALVTSTFRDHRAPLLEVSPKDLTAVIDDQVGAAWRWSQRFVLALDDSDEGSIVHVSSVHAYLAAANSGPYAAAKAALAALTRTMAIEWGPRGVRCNAVAPGFVPVARNAARWSDTEQLQTIAEALPLRRTVSSTDVANCAVFLAGPLAHGITGVCIPVDAGMLAAMPLWA